MKRLSIVAAVIVIVAGGAVLHGTPAESAENSEFGSVAGSVQLVGTAPPPESRPVTTDTNVCGDEQMSESLVVDPQNGVQWAVVRVLGVEGPGPTETGPMQLDQTGCRFVPHVSVAVVGQPFNIINSDGVLHNFHTFSETNSPMNMAQPGFRKEMAVTFQEPEIIRVGCDVHSWMAGYIVVSDSPYVTVTAADGSFNLPELPPGTYQVAVWHERLGEEIQEVTIAAGEETQIAFELAAQ